MGNGPAMMPWGSAPSMSVGVPGSPGPDRNLWWNSPGGATPPRGSGRQVSVVFEFELPPALVFELFRSWSDHQARPLDVPPGARPALHPLVAGAWMGPPRGPAPRAVPSWSGQTGPMNDLSGASPIGAGSSCGSGPRGHPRDRLLAPAALGAASLTGHRLPSGASIGSEARSGLYSGVVGAFISPVLAGPSGEPAIAPPIERLAPSLRPTSPSMAPLLFMCSTGRAGPTR